MVEIRWHGRGGQGVKTAALLLAETVIEEGKYGQGFPEYGPERMGAPVKGYDRISEQPIRIHSPIKNPDVVVVLDETIIAAEDVTEGLRKGGTVLVNTPKSPQEIRKFLRLQDGKVHTLDATKIALDTIGRPIPNMVMIGALIKLTNILDLETFEKNFRKKFEKRLAPEVVEGNIKAIRRAFEEVRSE